MAPACRSLPPPALRRSAPADHQEKALHTPEKPYTRQPSARKALHTPAERQEKPYTRQPSAREKPYTRQPSARKKPYTGGRAKMTKKAKNRRPKGQNANWKSLFGKLQKCQKSQESTPKRSKRHGRRWKRPGQLGSFFKQHEMGAGSADDGHAGSRQCFNLKR